MSEHQTPAPDTTRCQPEHGKACDSLTEFAVIAGDRGGLQWWGMRNGKTFKRTVDRLGIWRPKCVGRQAFASFCPFCGAHIGDGFKAGCGEGSDV